MQQFKDNPITTTIGVVIILASLVSVFYNACSWTEATLGIGCGAGFLYSKDHNK